MAHHGFTITRRDIDNATRHLEHAKRLRDPQPAKHSGVKGKAIQTAEVGLAAFGMGVLKGRFPSAMNLGPVPVDLAAFVALSLVSFTGMAGKYGDHMHNIANGVGAGYLHGLGAEVGLSWGLKSNPQVLPPAPVAAAPTALAKGYLGGRPMGSGTAPLTQAELRAMAHSVR